jgi:MFS family permease
MEVEEIKPDSMEESLKPTWNDHLRKFSLHAALTSFWGGQAFVVFALGAVIWPMQVETLVGKNSKELYLGLLSLASSLVNVLIPPLAGALSDRSTNRLGKRRPLLIAGTVIAVIGNLLSAIFCFNSGTTFPFMFYFLCGTTALLTFGMSLSAGSFTGIMPDLIPSDQQGVASGSLGVGRSVGQLFGVLFGGLILSQIPLPYGYITAYSLCVVVLIIVLVQACLSFREQQQPNDQVPKFKIVPFLKSFWLSPKEYRDFYMVFLCRIFYETGIYMLIGFFYYYLEDVFLMKNPQMGNTILLSVTLVCSILVSIVSGYVSDRIGRKVLVLVSIYVTVLAYFIFALLALVGAPVWLVYVNGIILGTGMGIFYSVDWALVLDVLPNRDAIARDMGLWHISTALPSMLSPFLTGVILDLLRRVLQYKFAWTILIMVAVLWILLSPAFLPFIKKKTPGNPIFVQKSTIHMSDVLDQLPDYANNDEGLGDGTQQEQQMDDDNTLHEIPLEHHDLNDQDIKFD